MRAPCVVLVILASVHCASCFFPLFFPGPIIYPKTTTEAPTTPAPPPPPPQPKVGHSYQPKHSYQPRHYYSPYRGHYSHHHYIEYDEGYPVEEHEEEVTEPPTTTTTTTTTTTPKPTTKKPHHYYRLVYPKSPHVYFPNFPYFHNYGGHYSHPPSPPVSYPYHGHHQYPAARKLPYNQIVPEPEEDDGPPPSMKEGPPPKMKQAPPKSKKPPPPPPVDDSKSMESMDSGEKNIPPPKPPKSAYRPTYENGPRRRPSPGQPYPDQFQNPMLRRPSGPPPVYKGGPPRRPNLPPRANRPRIPQNQVEVTPEDIAAMEMFEPGPLETPSKYPTRGSRPRIPLTPVEVSPEELVSLQKYNTRAPKIDTTPPPTPAVPPKTRKPIVYVTPFPTSTPETTASSPPLPPSKIYLPNEDDNSDDIMAGAFTMPSPIISPIINKRLEPLPKGRGALEPPIRMDGSNFQHWNRRDNLMNPQLESTSFDTLSYNFIREMIANSTMSSIAQ